MASQHGHEKQNPHTILLHGAAPAADAVTGQYYFPLATTRAAAIEQAAYHACEFSEPVCALEINNNSAAGEYIRYSIDGGESWQRLNAGQIREFEPWNTSAQGGKGFFCITRVLIIASATSAYVEVTPHFNNERKRD